MVKKITSIATLCNIVWPILTVFVCIYMYNKYRINLSKRILDTFTQQQLNEVQKELNNQKRMYSYMMNKLPTHKDNLLAPSVHTIDELNEFASKQLGTELNYQCRLNKQMTENTPCHFICKNSDCRSKFGDIKNTKDGYKWELKYDKNEPPILVDGLPKTLNDYCNTKSMNMNQLNRYVPDAIADTSANDAKMLNVYNDIANSLQISGNKVLNKSNTKTLHL